LRNLYLCLFFPVYLSTLIAEENILEDTSIKETFILKTMSNGTYPNAPYANVLLESKTSKDTYDVDLGLVVHKGYSDTYATINQMSLSYLGEQYEFKIGNYVNTLGKMDYLSTTNLINPTNIEFFDDENINIRKIPILMSQISYYPNDTWKLEAIVQPFNSNYQDYTNTYINIILNTLLPQYINSLTQDSATKEILNQYIFVPTYDNYISPALANDINNNYTRSSDINIDKLGGFLVAEFTGESATIGGVWMNRYSEIPLIRVNEDVVNILQDLENDQSATTDLTEYAQGEDLGVVNGVDTYRYNQYSLYYESTIDRFGIRAESSFRDKVPVVNAYSWLSSFGFGIDYKSKYIYSNLEMQWLHLDYKNQDLYAGIYSAKSEAFNIINAKLYLDYYLLFGYYNQVFELTNYPNLTLEYEDYSLAFQYLYSKENEKLNNLSLVLKASFE